MRVRTKASAALLAAVSTLALVGPAAAATATSTDKTGDVSVYTSAPKNAHNKDIDLTSLSATSTKTTTKVTLKVAAVSTYAGYGQQYTAQIIPAKEPKAGFITSTSGIIVLFDYPAEAGVTPCRSTRVVDGVSTDITGTVTCYANPTADTVTFAVATTKIPKSPKYVFTNATTYARVWMTTGTGYFATSASDYITGMYTKVG